jgi:tetraacyldisaccharide 4'-kinase
LYGAVVALRNALFDRGLRRVARLPVPVISVGNLTVGGTGKTPLTIWLVAAARERGLRPGVLARGYGRADGAALNEEGMMLAARFPDLPQVQDPDRVRGGRELVRAGVDLVILDDAFQHRRIHRDRDLLCMDARAPLDDGQLLPSGLLREPASGLRRADAVVLTRAEALSAAELAARRDELCRHAGRELPVFAATHAPRDLRAVPGHEVVPLERLRGCRVGLLSAIARPASFESTVEALGAEIAWHERCRDHHRFTEAELAAVEARVRGDGVTLVVTEKDAPKLSAAVGAHWVLRIDLAFLGAVPDAELLGLPGRTGLAQDNA